MVTATLLHGHMLAEFSHLSKVVLEKFSHSVMGRAIDRVCYAVETALCSMTSHLLETF